MKKHLLAPFFLSLFFLFSCSKIFHVEDKLEGEWRLKTAEKKALLQSTTINTGYETGKFQFFNNGSASYQDGSSIMKGNWRMRVVNTGTSDNGNSGNNTGRVLNINLYDFTANRVLNLEFDQFRFTSRNRLVAEYQSPGYRYKYEFVRY
jgi:hypothetical protein